MSDFPTLFHITHWKAGSVWIDSILRECFPDRIVLPEAFRRQFLESPIEAGAVYPRTYVTRDEFEKVDLPAHSRRFVVIRDLRDTLVSWYFSLKLSHGLLHRPDLQPDREHLRAVSLKDGLHWLLDHWAMTKSGEIQRSWIDSDAPLLRYEELLTRDTELMELTLVELCGLPIDHAQLRRAVEASRFSEMSNGRQRGDERPDAHQRKGIAGDWRKYFGSDLKKAFKERYGDLLIQTGYASGSDW